MSTDTVKRDPKQRLDDVLVCLRLLLRERAALVLFLFLSAGTAVFELVSVSMLVPVLQGEGGAAAFASVPLLSHVAPLFDAPDLAGRLRLVAGAIAIALVLRAVFTFGSELVAAWLPLRIERDLRARVLGALLDVELAYVNQHDVGETSTFLGSYTANVAGTTRLLAQGFFQALMLTAYCVFMALLSWRLTLVAIVVLVLISLAMRLVTVHWLEIAGRRAIDAVRFASQVTIQILSNIKLIRLAVAEREMARRYDESIVRMLRENFRVARLQAVVQPVFLAFGGLFVASVFYASTFVFPDAGGDWTGLLLLFLFIIYRAMAPVNSLNALRAGLSRQLPSVELLSRVLDDTARRTPPNGSRPFTRLEEAVRFEGVSFEYPGSEGKALDDVDLVLPRRRMVAVVGASGAGKSTLVGTLARLHDPTHGRVSVDGVDLRDLDVHAWRRRLGVVSQDVGILNESLVANLRLGNPDASMEDVERAMAMAHADEFFRELPAGYDTVLGERGVRLSGGQQQRIAIARALLKRPEVLVLDEATSHLDSRSERAIQAAIETLRDQCTMLVIAHRLSTVVKADWIYVLDHGAVVESGTHEELIRRRGAYWVMVEHQQLDPAAGGSSADAAAGGHGG